MPIRTHWFGLAAALMLAGVPARRRCYRDRRPRSSSRSRRSVRVRFEQHGDHRRSRIEAIGPASSTPVPAGATRIDGKGKWVVPGLIDSHVHFFQSGNLYTRPDWPTSTHGCPMRRKSSATSPPSRDVQGLARERRHQRRRYRRAILEFRMRDAALGSPAAPRVAVAGPLISMVDRAKLDPRRSSHHQDHLGRRGRALVRRELGAQARFHQGLVHHQKGDDLAAQEAIVKAAGDAAHAGGARLAVHATELIVAKARSGPARIFLVHSVEDEAVDEEFLALRKKNRALYCPTLFVIQGYRYALSNTWQPTEAERRLADPQILAAMNDLQKIPKEMLPERVAKAMSQPAPPSLGHRAAESAQGLGCGNSRRHGTDAGNIGTLHGPSVFREWKS